MDAIVRVTISAMIVDPNASKRPYKHGEEVFHLCCDGCRATLAANLDSYLKACAPVAGAYWFGA